MEVEILLGGVAALILLAVTSMRYGADSREGFASKERELAARGIVWGGSLAARDRPTMSAPRNARLDAQDQGPDETCLAAPCGA